MDKKFKHTGDIGDLIYFLPVIKHYGGGVLFLDTIELSIKKIDEPVIQWPPLGMCDYNHLKMIRCGLDVNKYHSLKPLLEIQTYISSVELWVGAFSASLDCHNNIPFLIHVFPGKARDKNLCHFMLDWHKVPLTAVSKPWIVADKVYRQDILVSRSFRYRNPSFPWRKLCDHYRHRMQFMGTRDEHADFCRLFGNVPYLETVNFLEVARHLAGCLLFIGNQSACYALAEAMHVPSLQETSPKVPDCVFERENAAYVISESETSHNLINMPKTLSVKWF